MGQCGFGGQKQGEAHRRPGFGAFRCDTDAPQQQQAGFRALGTRDQQAGKGDQRLLAPWIDLQHPAIGGFRGGGVAGGAVAFRDAQQRLVPGRHDVRHRLH